MLATSRAIRKGTDAPRGGPDEPTEPEPDPTWRDRDASAMSPAGSVALTRMTCGPSDKSSVTFVASPRDVKGLPSTLTAYSTTSESLSRFVHEIETGVGVTDTFETYQPWSPSTPVKEAAVDGGVVSIRMASVWRGSMWPAKSVA